MSGGMAWLPASGPGGHIYPMAPSRSGSILAEDAP
jgi:hypothetical protein